MNQSLAMIRTPCNRSQTRTSPWATLSSQLMPTSQSPSRSSLLYVLAALVAATGCGPETTSSKPAAATEDWVRGTDDERFALVSKHLRGFDMAMVETGHRYAELYWAGQDRNWGYARYQLDKMQLAIELGLERRPKRAASAQLLLTNAVPLLRQAIEQKDAAAFATQFQWLTASCNVCHAMEQMPFVRIQPPEHRTSSVRFQP